MRKSIARILFVTVCIACTATWAQIGSITNPGHVVNAQGQPLKNAMITFINPDKRLNYAFSDANGNFGNSPVRVETGVHSVEKPGIFRDVNVAGTTVRFFINAPRNVKIDLFDMVGRLRSTVCNGNLEKGVYAIDLNVAAGFRLAQNVFFVKIQSDGDCVTRRIVGTRNTGGTVGRAARERANANAVPAVAKKAAAFDTLRVGKTGYKPVYIPISSATESVGTCRKAYIL